VTYLPPNKIACGGPRTDLSLPILERERLRAEYLAQFSAEDIAELQRWSYLQAEQAHAPCREANARYEAKRNAK
jgi:hypothetical protein